MLCLKYEQFLKEAGYSDPLKKREDFAISLRKKKKEEIIREKRRKL